MQDVKKFYRKVDRRSRKAMTDFLSNHFRYDTSNSCNMCTSYANNMKIDRIGLSHEQQMKLLDMMDCEGAYDHINAMIASFGCEHRFEWQAGFNGRSGGYLVLYAGGQKPTDWKSYCTNCGQRNYKTVEKSGCRCGRCGKDTRKDYIVPPISVYTTIGKAVDMGEDFEDWTMEELRNRVQLIEEFDKLCDDIVEEAAYMADSMAVEEQEILVPVKKKFLTEAMA